MPATLNNFQHRTRKTLSDLKLWDKALVMPGRAFSQHNQSAFGPPVLLSVPHAGRDYGDYSADLRVPLRATRPLEDRYADRLVGEAITAGVPAIIARTPRLVIDLNRAPEDLDPAMIRGRDGASAPLSVKARGGLGLIPSRLGGTGLLWRTALDPEEVERRLSDIYRPYHAVVAQTLEALLGHWGSALLIDLHSMPPIAEPDAPDIVIGDRFGRTAASHLTEAAVAILTGLGFRVACNAPYAGGHIIQHHARPGEGVHALQLEIDRRLYLDMAMDQPGPGLARMQRVIATLVQSLGDELTGRLAAAAE